MFPFCVLTILLWSKRMANVNNPLSLYCGRLCQHSTKPIHAILCPPLWLKLYCPTLIDGLCCVCVCVCVAVSQLCLTLCDPMDSSCPGKNTGVGSHSLVQGIFLTHGSNPGLPHRRQILYYLSHQGSPKNTGVGSHSPLQGFSRHRD